MKKAIYIRLLLITAMGLLLCSLLSAAVFASRVESSTEAWLKTLTFSVAENYRHGGDVYELAGVGERLRITLIKPDGAVLADSQADPAHMENHGDREEVKGARPGKVTVAMRKSASLGRGTMYAATVMPDGIILRTAVNYEGFWGGFMAQIPSLLVTMLAALILSLFVARMFSRSLTVPLERVVDAFAGENYEAVSDYKSGYYEIDRITQSTRNLLQEITESKRKALLEKEKLDYLLSNMAEGFILLDGQKNMILCNDSTRSMFGAAEDPLHQNILFLTRNHDLNRVIDTVMESRQAVNTDIALSEGRIINVYVSPVNELWNARGDAPGGITILLFDVTAERQIYKQKQEFFSNASHELKTPITSIAGFAEVLNRDMVIGEDEKKNIFALIQKESNRMTNLINDILLISKLETKGAEKEYEVFDLACVVKEAVDALAPLAVPQNIGVIVNVQSVMVSADRRRLRELSGNLIENAIKYNKPGGKVTVCLARDQDNANFTVSDTGIGIPEANQPRLFERFYRVDRGRDKKIGGTGLGLSIVKHIVNSYNGEITLQSRKGEGTCITVRLPIVSLET